MLKTPSSNELLDTSVIVVVPSIKVVAAVCEGVEAAKVDGSDVTVVSLRGTVAVVGCSVSVVGSHVTCSHDMGDNLILLVLRDFVTSCLLLSVYIDIGPNKKVIGCR